MLRRLAAAAALCLIAYQARASVLWRGDFESNDLLQWSSVDGLTSRLTVVSSPVRQGSRALRVELRSGDFASNGNRNELVRQVPETEGMDRYYAWSTLFDASYPIENKWQVFTQWHHSGCCGSPPLEFDVNGQTLSLDRNPPSNSGTVELWSTLLVRGVWHDFVMHVIWSSNPDLGFIELWYDGQKVIEGKAVQTLFPGQVNYLKQGLYRDSSISAVGVVYHDGMTMGTTLADVAPQLVPPPPPPPPPLRLRLPMPALPMPALPMPALPTPALPMPALPTPALPTPALPTPALPTPALPTPALPTPGPPGRPPTAE